MYIFFNRSKSKCYYTDSLGGFQNWVHVIPVSHFRSFFVNLSRFFSCMMLFMIEISTKQQLSLLLFCYCYIWGQECVVLYLHSPNTPSMR